ncbi:hypothetical protein HRG49_13380 [Enterococcus faecalis]|uniref:hypothetical protein n=1 Tax=unclassified Bacillus (in: firmicutes) TaxID=185979 RepID=UPI000DC41EA2|nr:hypothetical protein [Bacillus sp. SRB_8]NST54712.1 hypothetical protein [Enterococcus faecalis]RAN71169.1 hypothetical protein B5P40_08825 [Bacillus sp. SRB_8]
MERFNSAGTDKAVIEAHILRIEEELHFLLSLLQQDEIDELLSEGLEINWTNLGPKKRWLRVLVNQNGPSEAKGVFDLTN